MESGTTESEIPNGAEKSSSRDASTDSEFVTFSVAMVNHKKVKELLSRRNKLAKKLKELGERELGYDTVEREDEFFKKEDQIRNLIAEINNKLKRYGIDLDRLIDVSDTEDLPEKVIISGTGYQRLDDRLTAFLASKDLSNHLEVWMTRDDINSLIHAQSDEDQKDAENERKVPLPETLEFEELVVSVCDLVLPRLKALRTERAAANMEKVWSESNGPVKLPELDSESSQRQAFVPQLVPTVEALKEINSQPLAETDLDADEDVVDVENDDGKHADDEDYEELEIDEEVEDDQERELTMSESGEKDALDVEDEDKDAAIEAMLLEECKALGENGAGVVYDVTDEDLLLAPEIAERDLGEPGAPNDVEVNALQLEPSATSVPSLVNTVSAPLQSRNDTNPATRDGVKMELCNGTSSQPLPSNDAPPMKDELKVEAPASTAGQCQKSAQLSSVKSGSRSAPMSEGQLMGVPSPLVAEPPSPHCTVNTPSIKDNLNASAAQCSTGIDCNGDANEATRALQPAREYCDEEDEILVLAEHFVEPDPEIDPSAFVINAEKDGYVLHWLAGCPEPTTIETVSLSDDDGEGDGDAAGAAGDAPGEGGSTLSDNASNENQSPRKRAGGPCAEQAKRARSSEDEPANTGEGGGRNVSDEDDCIILDA